MSKWTAQQIDTFFGLIMEDSVLELSLMFHHSPITEETLNDIVDFLIPMLRKLNRCSIETVSLVYDQIKAQTPYYSKEKMLESAIAERCIFLIDKLIELGADLNSEQPLCRGAINQCMMTGRHGILRHILEKGADPNIKIGDFTPLDIAMHLHDKEAIEILKEHGATEVSRKHTDEYENER